MIFTAVFRKRLYLCLAALALVLLAFCLPEEHRQWLGSLGQFLGRPARAAAGTVTAGAKDILTGRKEPLSPAEQEEVLASLATLKIDLAEAQAQSQSFQSENKQLRELLGLVKAARQYSFCVASVIRRDALSDYHATMLIDKGTRDGLKIGQAVLSPAGLLGVIKSVAPDSAEIRLLGHRDFTLTCRIPARRLTGLLTSAPDSDHVERPSLLLPPSPMQMQATSGLQFDSGVVGDQVVTSSLGNEEMLDGIIIGTITKTDIDTAGAPVMQVTPAATDSQLDFVLVAIPAK